MRAKLMLAAGDGLQRDPGEMAGLILVQYGALTVLNVLSNIPLPIKEGVLL